MKDLLSAAKRVLELRGDNGHSLGDEIEAFENLHAQVQIAETAKPDDPAPDKTEPIEPVKLAVAKKPAAKKTAAAKKTTAATKR